jgi:hypothetical protein
MGYFKLEVKMETEKIELMRKVNELFDSLEVDLHTTKAIILVSIDTDDLQGVRDYTLGLLDMSYLLKDSKVSNVLEQVRSLVKAEIRRKLNITNTDAVRHVTPKYEPVVTPSAYKQ